jgi:heme O synthase-like polyprenyltransferase
MHPATLLSLTKPRIAGLLCLSGVAATFAAGGLPFPSLAAAPRAGVRP